MSATVYIIFIPLVGKPQDLDRLGVSTYNQAFRLVVCVFFGNIFSLNFWPGHLAFHSKAGEERRRSNGVVLEHWCACLLAGLLD